MVLLVFGMSILCSCNEVGGESSRNKLASTIVGDWVIVKDGRTDHFEFYWSFSNDGTMTRYSIDPCDEVYYSNGTLYATESVKYEVLNKVQYSIKNNDVYMAGMLWETINIVNKDKLSLIPPDEYSFEGTMERIKNFKTKE